VREEGGGEWKGQIRTIKLETLPAGVFADRESQARLSVIEGNSLSYLKRREQIEEEMKRRGRFLNGNQKPQVQDKEPSRPKAGPEEPDEPPPPWLYKSRR
jgi:hypothetical protein